MYNVSNEVIDDRSSTGILVDRNEISRNTVLLPKVSVASPTFTNETTLVAVMSVKLIFVRYFNLEKSADIVGMTVLPVRLSVRRLTISVRTCRSVN